MTPQEEQLLNSLVERVNQTQLQEKDPDAEALLNQRLGPNPDAIYILAQTVLVQNIALDQAKAQVAQLQQQAQQQRPQPAHTTSFLGRLLGEREPEPPVQQPPQYQPVNTGYGSQYAQPAPQYAQPTYQQPQYVAVGGGQPSFLRGAMQTAAGVAAGALAFEGVEAILHGMGGGGYGFGGPGIGMGGGFGRPVEETVINNYYDEPGRGAEHGGYEHGGEHHLMDTDQGGDNLRGFEQDSSASASDADNFGAVDQSAFDDSSSFDSGSDDGGSFDGGNDGF